MLIEAAGGHELDPNEVKVSTPYIKIIPKITQIIGNVCNLLKNLAIM